MEQKLWSRSQYVLRRKRVKQIFLLAIILLILILGLIVFLFKRSGNRETDLLSNSDKFYKGIYVEKISLGGMTIPEAKKAILSKVEADCTWDMQVIYEETTYKIKNILSCNVDEILQAAILIGHSGDDTQRLKEIRGLKKNPVHYSIEGNYDDEVIDDIVKEIAEKLNVTPVNADLAGYDQASNDFLYTKSVIGYDIDTTDLEKQITKALSEKKYDAKIQAKMSQIQPEIDDTTIKERVVLIGEFITNTTSNPDRNANITIASNAINDRLIKPGEEFSMNEITGPRTIENGYKPAGVIINGKLAEEPGGGVCQVSTTIYNAVVKAGLNTTERLSHSLEPSYVNLGEDSMVSYPGADLKFENNGTSSILIRISLQNQVLKASVYGIPILEEGVTVEMLSELGNTIPIPKPIYQEDTSLKYGEEVVVNPGREGKKIVTYLVVKKNGVEVSKEFLHNSVYKPKTPIVKKNSKAKPKEELPSASPDIDETSKPDSENDVGQDNGRPEEEESTNNQEPTISPPATTQKPETNPSPTTNVEEIDH